MTAHCTFEKLQALQSSHYFGSRHLQTSRTDNFPLETLEQIALGGATKVAVQKYRM